MAPSIIRPSGERKRKPSGGSSIIAPANSFQLAWRVCDIIYFYIEIKSRLEVPLYSGTCYDINSIDSTLSALVIRIMKLPKTEANFHIA